MAAEGVERLPVGAARADRPAVRALRAGALVVMYGYLLALGLGPHTFQFWREFGLQNLALGLICGYIWVKVAIEREHRSWRIPLAGVPTALLANNLVVNAHLDAATPQQQANLAALVALFGYPCWLTGIIQVHRGRWTRLSRGAVLDSLVAVQAIAAGFTAFVLPAALRAATVGRVTPLLVLAMPILDLTMLGLTVAMISMSGSMPERMSGWLVGAVLIFGLSDSSYAISNALGTWQLGTIMDGTWVVACALVALGAGAGPPSARITRTWGSGVLIVPLAAGASSVALLVVGNWWPLPATAVVLAAAAAGVALLRLADAYAQLGALAETQRLAATDELTGLANRRRFVQLLDERLERGGPFSVLLVDLDRFKEINDTLGHGVGDELLRLVAQRLASGLPPGGLLARLGGDEFAACLETTAAGSVAAAERVLATLGPPVLVGGFRLSVAASIGICDRSAEAATRSELLRRADVAMYLAKRAGGGIRVHGPGADAALLRHVALLRAAIPAQPAGSGAAAPPA